ncbi:MULTISPECIES: hypothetical protein [unclassified Roseiflexus]|mgnify:FL=1|jgi:hypothetical protein|uniref:hypothetical protein n=1 Tax=unclassified Roseiflexus TaxID=2609473 RepID=UPI0000D7FF3A|nr:MULTISPECIES: hypothetical protein [unclassified Roseiflexus]ABQ90129.1 hypothetical protein RoseRS_1739 [Roseiflexus sp. RS-1]MCL6540979.1 hypothetical protein [Roseiflexus sp.]
MSGGLKSGLIFALVSIIAVVGFSFIPAIGVFCCGPIATMALGAIAGYIGVRWSGPTAGIGSGTLAGGISGIGALIGSVIFWIVAILIAQSDPALFDEIIRQVEEQQPASGLTEDDIRNLIGFVGPVIGFCAGLIHLLFAVLLGALGGWLAVRQRPQPPMAPPAYTVG